MKANSYGMHRTLPGFEFGDAVERVTQALAREGFGVLTSIDVQRTLQDRLGVDFRPYTILGACNPELAHRALSEDDSVGLLLPCNVVVAATDDGSEVSIVRPPAMLEMVRNPSVHAVAEEAQARLERVLEDL